MAAPQHIPTNTQILVIGGGPGGSYAATCLAREGCDVVLLEADRFPRYHIGESTLPSMRSFLRFIGFLDEFESHGFTHKNGAAFKLNAQKNHGFTDFLEEDKENHAWNLVRSESDEMFLRYAERCGVKVFEGMKVMELEFDGARPVAAYHANTSDGSMGRITFDYLIDSSGRAGIMSTKYLKNRRFNPSFKNMATWGYWRGVNSYRPDDDRLKGFPFFEALNDNTGWAWFFPLHTGQTSVGLVMNQDAMNEKRKASSAANTREFYEEELRKRAPTLVRLIGNGQLVEGDKPSTTVRSASDYSYSAKSYAGPHYRLVGDAACFIDPYFSSGIHLAQTSGLSAAATILASIKGSCSETHASEWHNQRVDISYTRFLVVVLTAYRQIRAQDTPVLSEISEDGFDRAFDHFRSIIQGKLDAQQQLVATAPNLRQTIDFCKAAFDSSTVGSCPSSPSSSIMPRTPSPTSNSEDQCPSIAGEDEDDDQEVVSAPPPIEARQKAIAIGAPVLDSAVKNVITQTTAMRFMTTGESFMIDNLISDEILGMKLSLRVGDLGLIASPLS